MLRHISLGRMYNLRDLGGYPVPGGVTAWERLLRGDNPEGLTEEDLRWLLDRGITTVVDLRSEAETGRKPDQLASQPGFYYFHCPLLSEGDGMPNLETDVGQGYFRMLDGSDLVAKAMRTVAAAPAGVLFHCTAGKDRTGLLAALLLGLAGAERTELLADYQVSETYLADVIRQIKARVPDLSAFAGASKAEYLSGCLDLLEEKYGSIPGYLRAIGLTEGELTALRGKLLPPDIIKGGPALG